MGRTNLRKDGVHPQAWFYPQQSPIDKHCADVWTGLADTLGAKQAMTLLLTQHTPPDGGLSDNVQLANYLVKQFDNRLNRHLDDVKTLLNALRANGYSVVNSEGDEVGLDDDETLLSFVASIGERSETKESW